MSDRKKEQIKIARLLIFAFILYFPFIFLGYGSDSDSYGIAGSAQIIARQHYYIPSRLPGNPAHELFSAFLFIFGRSIMTNLGILCMSLLAIYFFLKICEIYHIPHKYLLAIFMMINPLYYTASTSTIDYLMALAFLLLGYYLLLQKRYLAAGIFWGIAVGVRLNSLIFPFAVFMAYFIINNDAKKKALLAFFLSGIIGGLFYMLPFWHAGFSIRFLWPYTMMGTWNFWGHLIRVIYKNIYFWGLQTCITLAIFLPFIKSGLKKTYAAEYKEIIVVAICVIIVFEILFLRFPLEKHYLIPILPFVLILLGISLKEHKWALVFLLVIQLSYNFINFNLAHPDVRNNATTAKVGFWIEKGYLLNDVVERLEWKKILR